MASFQHHLTALSAEFERLVIENSELKKQFPKEASPDVAAKCQTNAWQAPHTVDTSWDPPPQPVGSDHTSEKAPFPGMVEVETLHEVAPRGTSKRSSRRHATILLHHVKEIGEDEESEYSATFLLLLDAIPALVIFANAVVAGVSADVGARDGVWNAVEAAFAGFFVAEFLLRIKVFGPSELFLGEDWYWTWFDLLCIILALTELGISYSAGGGEQAPSAMSSVKMLKLARFGRIVRLLKFKIFRELKLMIHGVLTGLRVLFWAVVLLIACIYLLGVSTRTIYPEVEEFASVPDAMFTWFRCFTDGCTTYSGAPLQDKLYRASGPHGGLLMFTYILSFLFVTIGVFNLIMAVFIDNVMEASVKKKQRSLGFNSPRTTWLMASELRHLMLKTQAQEKCDVEVDSVMTPPRESVLRENVLKLQEMYGATQEYDEMTDEIREDMAKRGRLISRDELNNWLSTEQELLDVMEDAEIDLSCKSDLFDVFDANLDGLLHFDEMVEGMLRCRGPVSKTDIIAVRLKTRLLVRMVTKICEKLDIDTEGLTA